jgi:DNA-binding response OmpR family regulator
MSVKKIIVVDDDESLLESLNLLLSEEGYKVFPYKNGKNFKKNVSLVHPDLILMDVILPGVYGDDLIKELRGSENGISKTPVFLMSASGSAKDRSRDVDVFAFVDKPFDINDLLKKVHQVLG